MYKIPSIILLLLIPIVAIAQGKNDYQWVTGYGPFEPHFGGTKIDFKNGVPALTHFALPYQFGFNMPCSISDENGNLQFYSSGCKIVNFENEVIENGDDLSPGFFQSIECENNIYGYDSYQNMLILPRPGKLGRYIYFHHTIEPNIADGKVLYSEIDMMSNNGKGKVILKNQILRGPVQKEWALTAVKHGNGRDWWIIVPQEKVNIYNLYLLTPDTIAGPFAQDWENSEASQYEKFGLNVVISPDGMKFARMTNSDVSVPKIYLYEFDRCSGTFSMPRTIHMPDSTEFSPWIAISPNSKLLYLQSGQTKLYQYDLSASDISASVKLVGLYDGFETPQGFSGEFNAMALAPNNKIYMCCTSGIYYYHTIHKPDRLGTACDFRQHDLELPTVSNNLMPNFPNFRLGPLDGSACDTLGIDNLPVAHFRWEVEDTLSPQQIEFTDLSYYEPATWLWDFGDGSASQDTSPVHLYAAPGIYQVCLTVCNANACDTTCKEVEVKTVNTISAHGESGGFTLWPNPASDILHIKCEAPLTGEAVISDFSGRSVLEAPFRAETKTLDIPIAHLENGIYVISFSDASGKLPISVKFAVLR